MPPKIEQAQAKGTLMQECGLLIDCAMFQEHYDAFILECFRYFWYFLNACFSSILFCSSKGAWIDSTFGFSLLSIIHPVYLLLIDMFIMQVLCLKNTVIYFIRGFPRVVIDIELASTPSDSNPYVLSPATYSLQKCPIFVDLYHAKVTLSTIYLGCQEIHTKETKQKKKTPKC